MAKVIEMRHQELSERRRERAERREREMREWHKAQEEDKNIEKGGGGRGEKPGHTRPPSGAASSGLSRKKREERRIECEMRRIDADVEAKRRQKNPPPRPSIESDIAACWLARARGESSDLGRNMTADSTAASSSCGGLSGIGSPIQALSPRVAGHGHYLEDEGTRDGEGEDCLFSGHGLEINLGQHVFDFSASLRERLKDVSKKIMAPKVASTEDEYVEHKTRDLKLAGTRRARMPWDGHPFRMRGGEEEEMTSRGEGAEGVVDDVDDVDEDGREEEETQDDCQGREASHVRELEQRGGEKERARDRERERERDRDREREERKRLACEFAVRAVEGRVRVRRMADMGDAFREWGGIVSFKTAVRRKTVTFWKRHAMSRALKMLRDKTVQDR